jgi:putative FmdB family regulatory protein
MPVYEYECQDCGKTFEEFQNITDKPLKTCRFCGGRVTRLISQTSFSLKGSGWYKDGYSTPKPAKGAKAPVQETKSGSVETNKKTSKEGS